MLFLRKFKQKRECDPIIKIRVFCAAQPNNPSFGIQRVLAVSKPILNGKPKTKPRSPHNVVLVLAQQKDFFYMYLFHFFLKTKYLSHQSFRQSAVYLCKGCPQSIHESESRKLT